MLILPVWSKPPPRGRAMYKTLPVTTSKWQVQTCDLFSSTTQAQDTTFPSTNKGGEALRQQHSLQSIICSFLSGMSGNCRNSRCPPGTPELNPKYLQVSHPSGAVTTVPDHIRAQMKKAAQLGTVSLFFLLIIFNWLAVPFYVCF